MDHHSWLGGDGTPGEDLRRVADCGASVAHSPTVFARTAHGLESFANYRAAGVNVALATDTSPNNMPEEMRLASHLSRVLSKRVEGSDTAAVFYAATIGGSRALGRDDIGRLLPGCRADFFTVDLTHPLMHPQRDPLRNLIHTAADRAICDVYVAGNQVVRDGENTTLDYISGVKKLTTFSKRMADNVKKLDPVGRDANKLAPLSLRIKER